MLNNLPFFSKWQIDTAQGIVQFSDWGSLTGTVLVVYKLGDGGYGTENVALQCVCYPPGATKPADLPWMRYFPVGDNFAIMQAYGRYPDDFVTIMEFPNAPSGIVLAAPSVDAALGYWPGQPGGGFGWNMWTDPGVSAPYQVLPYAPSAAQLRAGMVPDTADYSFASLANEDYTNLTLLNANFSYADLTNTPLDGTQMAGAIFKNVFSVVGSSMSGCDLAGADFTGVNATGMNFNGSLLDGAIVAGATLTNASFVALDGKAVSLQNVDFSKVVSLTGAKFTGANLTGANFSGLDLTGVDFGGTQLQGASFNGCDLTRCTFSTPPTLSTSEAALTSFAHATLHYALIGLDWSYLDLTEANIEGMPTSLVGLKAVWSNLTGLVLKQLPITDAVFNNATLQNVTFAQSDLSRSHFISAQLQGDTLIPSATLTNCMLMDVDFTGANLTSVDLTGAYFYGSSALLKNATIQLTNFADAYLTGVDFSGVLNADFQGVTFSGACLVNAIFHSVNIQDFRGKRTTFANACLQGADFTGATIVGCELYDAGISLAPGTISLTVPIHGVPIPLPTKYNATVGLQAATDDTTVCADGSTGPCTLPQQLTGLNPPTQWPA